MEKPQNHEYAVKNIHIKGIQGGDQTGPKPESSQLGGNQAGSDSIVAHRSLCKPHYSRS